MNIKSVFVALALTQVALAAMADSNSNSDDRKPLPVPTAAATLSVTGGAEYKKESFDNILTGGYTSESGKQKRYDVGATLSLLGTSDVTFEFVGKEADYTNVLFVFGNSQFNNRVAKGTSVTFSHVAAGVLDFGFKSQGVGSIYKNGSTAIAFMSNKSDTSALALFNDAYGDHDFDDMGVKISAVASLAPVPEPETYALLLAGLGLVGTMVRRRKVAVAA
jgi:hypothetical protein